MHADSLSEREMKRICKPLQAMRKRQDKARALRDLFVTSCIDEELDSHFKIFSKPEVLELINDQGDIERPVSLGLSLLRRVPEFRGLALKAGMQMIKTR